MKTGYSYTLYLRENGSNCMILHILVARSYDNIFTSKLITNKQKAPAQSTFSRSQFKQLDCISFIGQENFVSYKRWNVCCLLYPFEIFLQFIWPVYILDGSRGLLIGVVISGRGHRSHDQELCPAQHQNCP